MALETHPARQSYADGSQERRGLPVLTNSGPIGGSSSGSPPLLDDHTISDNYFQHHLGKHRTGCVIV